MHVGKKKHSKIARSMVYTEIIGYCYQIARHVGKKKCGPQLHQRLVVWLRRASDRNHTPIINNNDNNHNDNNHNTIISIKTNTNIHNDMGAVYMFVAWSVAFYTGTQY